MSAHSKKRLAIISLVIVALVASSFGSFLILGMQNDDRPAVERITVGLLPHEIGGLVYVASAQGYFDDNRLNVTIMDYSSGLAAVNGMLNGEVDIATAADFVLVGKALENHSLVAIGNIDKFSSEYIVVRTDLGISNVSDLKGKRIGVPMGTVAEFNLGRFLELAGIDLDQVTFVDVPIYLTPAALTNGSVQAVITWQPHFNAIKSLINDKVIAWQAQNDRLVNYLAIANQSWALNHPDIVERFLKALSQAEKFMIHDPERSKDIVQSRLNYTEEYTEQIWPENQFSLSLDQSLILAMEDQARWMIRNNLTQNEVPNFLHYIYFDGLEAVDPGSVNIIR